MPTTFSAVWREGTGEQKVLLNGTLADFNSNYETFTAQGLRLVALDASTLDGAQRWAAAWREGTDEQKVLLNGSLDEFNSNYETFTAQGLRLVALNATTTAAAFTLVLHVRILADPGPDLLQTMLQD